MLEELLKFNIQIQHFKKGEVLQHASQKSTRAFFVKSGLVRSYIIDPKGKEHIFMFASEGWLISDIESQVFGNESVLFIDAIEDSEIMPIDNKLLIEANNLDGQRVQKMIDKLFKRIGVMQRRILALMSSSARERYESFLDIYPDLPNRVSQKMIASYLGITPEALSTIRRQILQNE